MVSSDARNLCDPHSQSNQKPSIKSVECGINYGRLTIAERWDEIFFAKIFVTNFFGHIPADHNFE